MPAGAAGAAVVAPVIRFKCVSAKQTLAAVDELIRDRLAMSRFSWQVALASAEQIRQNAELKR
jgi:hypothetical protein